MNTQKSSSSGSSDSKGCYWLWLKSRASVSVEMDGRIEVSKQAKMEDVQVLAAVG